MPLSVIIMEEVYGYSNLLLNIPDSLITISYVCNNFGKISDLCKFLIRGTFINTPKWLLLCYIPMFALLDNLQLYATMKL